MFGLTDGRMPRNSDEFNKSFEARRKQIRFYFKLIASIVLVIVMLYIGAIYYGYTVIQDNGGIRATAVNILKEVNSIQKEAEIK